VISWVFKKESIGLVSGLKGTWDIFFILQLRQD
jgi:hypothetical protein